MFYIKKSATFKKFYMLFNKQKKMNAAHKHTIEAFFEVVCRSCLDIGKFFVVQDTLLIKHKRAPTIYKKIILQFMGPQGGWGSRGCEDEWGMKSFSARF